MRTINRLLVLAFAAVLAMPLSAMANGSAQSAAAGQLSIDQKIRILTQVYGQITQAERSLAERRHQAANGTGLVDASTTLEWISGITGTITTGLTGMAILNGDEDLTGTFGKASIIAWVLFFSGRIVHSYGQGVVKISQSDAARLQGQLATLHTQVSDGLNELGAIEATGVGNN